MHRSTFLVASLMMLLLFSTSTHATPRRDVHAFFYLWYGAPPLDAAYLHWSHEVLPHWRKEENARWPTVGTYFEAPDDAGAAYRPARGLYSSSDPVVLAEQMRELAAAGVGVVSASWWGQERFGAPASSDGQNVTTDRVMAPLLDAAHAAGVQVCLHLEPYPSRTPATVARDVRYIFEQYGSHPAFYRATEGPRAGRALFYVYDAYLSPAAEWRVALGELRAEAAAAAAVAASSSSSSPSVSTAADFVALYLEPRESESFVLEGAFDGVYTYFAAKQFTYGANPRSWPAIAAWAARHSLLFIPCVAPGYDDTPIRPWNGAQTNARRGGQYYDYMWRAALALTPRAHAIAITSYNEWGEGTQIEPAREYTAPRSGRHVPGYEGGETFYLDRTHYWVEHFARSTEPSIAVGGGTRVAPAAERDDL